MILLESITTRLQQDYPKFTLSFLWFYRNHYGKFTASFEQISNVYFGDIKKWLGRGLGQCSRKVLILPPPSCAKCSIISYNHKKGCFEFWLSFFRSKKVEKLVEVFYLFFTNSIISRLRRISSIPGSCISSQNTVFHAPKVVGASRFFAGRMVVENKILCTVRAHARGTPVFYNFV